MSAFESSESSASKPHKKRKTFVDVTNEILIPIKTDFFKQDVLNTRNFLERNSENISRTKKQKQNLISKVYNSTSNSAVGLMKVASQSGMVITDKSSLIDDFIENLVNGQINGSNIKQELYNLMYPCISRTSERCRQCEACVLQLEMDFRRTIESSSTATQVNQLYNKPFKNGNLCCFICGFPITDDCEIEHVYSSTLTSILMFDKLVGRSGNIRQSLDNLAILCQDMLGGIVQVPIEENALVPAHRYCNRGKGNYVLTRLIRVNVHGHEDPNGDYIYVIPDDAQIDAYTEQYSTHIFNDLAPYTIYGVPAPVYLPQTSLKQSDKELIDKLQMVDKNTLKQNIATRVTATINRSSRHPIHIEQIKINLLAIMNLPDKLKKQPNQKYPRTVILTEKNINDFIMYELGINYKEAKNKETKNKVLTFVTKIPITKRVSKYEFTYNSNGYTLWEDELKTVYDNTQMDVIGGLTKKRRSNKANKTRNKRR
jgi:hypothetical protein